MTLYLIWIGNKKKCVLLSTGIYIYVHILYTGSYEKVVKSRTNKIRQCQHEDLVWNFSLTMLGFCITV